MLWACLHLFFVVIIKKCVICLWHVRTNLYLVHLIVFTVYFILTGLEVCKFCPMTEPENGGPNGRHQGHQSASRSIILTNQKRGQSVPPPSSKLSDVSVVTWQLTCEEWQNKCEIMIMWQQFVCFICEIFIVTGQVEWFLWWWRSSGVKER